MHSYRERRQHAIVDRPLVLDMHHQNVYVYISALAYVTADYAEIKY